MIIQPWFLAAGLSTANAAVAGVILYAIFNWWPSESSSQAQATLAAALIGLIGMLIVPSMKVFFDEWSLHTQHRLNVQASMLQKFYEYAGHYLMPLAAAASETARYLVEYNTRFPLSPDRQETSLDGAFYSAAQYVRLHATFKNTFSLPNADPPLGILLNSHQAEERLWNVMPPPWSLGIRTLSDESHVLDALASPDGGMRTPNSFTDLAHDPEGVLNKIRGAFEERVTSADLLDDLVNTLNTLNLLINYEVGKVFAPWYHDRSPFPKADFDKLSALPREKKDTLGIFYLE